MADYANFEFNLFSDLELAAMLKKSKELKDDEFCKAILLEFKKRAKQLEEE